MRDHGSLITRYSHGEEYFKELVKRFIREYN